MNFMVVTSGICAVAFLCFLLLVWFSPANSEDTANTGKAQAMKRRKSGKSIKQFLGFRSWHSVGCETDSGIIAFYEISPNNLSVLPESVIAYQIWRLQMLLQKENDVEILCMDGSETGAENLRYLQKRIAEETNPVLKDLLQKDKESFEDAHHAKTSTRQFYLVLRMDKKLTEEQLHRRAADVGKLLQEHNITAHVLNHSELRHMLGIYYIGYMYAEAWKEGTYYGYDAEGVRLAETRQEDAERTAETGEEAAARNAEAGAGEGTTEEAV